MQDTIWYLGILSVQFKEVICWSFLIFTLNAVLQCYLLYVIVCLLYALVIFFKGCASKNLQNVNNTSSDTLLWIQVKQIVYPSPPKKKKQKNKPKTKQNNNNNNKQTTTTNKPKNQNQNKTKQNNNKQTNNNNNQQTKNQKNKQQPTNQPTNQPNKLLYQFKIIQITTVVIVHSKQ